MVAGTGKHPQWLVRDALERRDMRRRRGVSINGAVKDLEALGPAALLWIEKTLAREVFPRHRFPTSNRRPPGLAALIIGYWKIVETHRLDRGAALVNQLSTEGRLALLQGVYFQWGFLSPSLKKRLGRPHYIPSSLVAAIENLTTSSDRRLREVATTCLAAVEGD